MCLDNLKIIKEANIISLIQHFKADFLLKVSLKILNSGLILKTFNNGAISCVMFGIVMKLHRRLQARKVTLNSEVQYRSLELLNIALGLCSYLVPLLTLCTGILTLKAPITTKVICFSSLLKCLRSLYDKQCGPGSDSSYRSSLIWVYPVCFYT